MPCLRFGDNQQEQILQQNMRKGRLPPRDGDQLWQFQEGFYLSKQGQNTRVVGWGREGKGDQGKNVSQLSEQGPTTEKVE